MRCFAVNAIDLLSGDQDGPSSPGLSSLSVNGRRSDPSGFIRKIFLFLPSPKLPRTNAIRPMGLTCSAYSERVAKHAHAPTLIENNSRRFNRLACMARLPLLLWLWPNAAIRLVAARKVSKSPGGRFAAYHQFGTPVMGFELLGCRPLWTSLLCEIGISRRSEPCVHNRSLTPTMLTLSAL